MKTKEESSRGTALDTRIALIHSGIEKLIKYFKLDRKSKSNADDPDGAGNPDEGNSKVLRDILERISEIGIAANRKEFTPEQATALNRIEDAVAKALREYHGSEHQELKSSLERIEQALDALKSDKQDGVVFHEHRHAIEIASSKVFISMIAMGLIILGLSFIVGNQRRTIARFRDSDLKYRYVKMHGEATSGDIEALETIFTYAPNHDSIKLIRRQVIQYERLVKQQAEKIEQTRLNASEAERLKQGVETVKGRK